MKTNCWLILGTMLATSAVAQVNTKTLPEIPAPATAPATTPALPPPAVDNKTNAPAKHVAKAKKHGAKKKAAAAHAAKPAAKLAESKPAAASSAPVTLTAGPATVTAENVNLRGQAGLNGEVVGHVKKGETVTVLAEINVDKPKAGEPAQWAKIGLPASSKVWLDGKYVDATNHVVTAHKLNLRGGPGENFSVLGVLEKGASVTPVTTKGDWMQIETPANAFAFVAAGLLKQDAGATTPAVAPVSAPVAPPAAPVNPPIPAPNPTPVAEAPAIAPPTPVVATPPPAPVTPAPAPESAPAPAIATPTVPTTIQPQPTLAPDETDTNLPPPPPRIVTHEGTVRHSVSLVAPTYYELFDPASGIAINYLFPPSTNLNLSLYNGKHIVVTGEEGMDVRWKDTPVLTVKELKLMPGEAVESKPVLKPVKTRK